MKLLNVLKRLSLLPMAQQLYAAEEELVATRLPERMVRRHSAFLYYSQRHHAQLRRSI
jgi:hypothetical protein